MCYPPTKTLILCLVTVLVIASRIPNMSTQRLASIYPCPPKNDGWPDFWSISLNQKLLWCCHITSSSKQTTSSLTGLIPPRESRDAFVVMIQNDVSPNHPLAKSGILLWSDDGQWCRSIMSVIPDRHRFCMKYKALFSALFVDIFVRPITWHI